MKDEKFNLKITPKQNKFPRIPTASLSDKLIFSDDQPAKEERQSSPPSTSSPLIIVWFTKYIYSFSYIDL
jgi:hypothetical protein